MKSSNLFILLILSAWAIPYFCVGQPALRPAVNIPQLIDSISLSLNRHYVFPAEAQRMSVYLNAQLQKKAYASLANTPNELVKQLQADLSTVHHDPHLFMDYNPAFTAAAPGSPSSAEEEMTQAKKYWQANNYLFRKVEVLPGNIGYFPFTGFVPDLAGAQPTITAGLQFVANTNALIIDLRENMGGSPEMVSLLESYFFKTKTHMNDLINRSTNDTTVFYADPVKARNLSLLMPIYILTSHRTFSGAEDFAYGMQMAKRAIIVGEKTGGGAHPTKPISVGQGIVISIPFARSLNPVTHTDWEGVGVIPTVSIEASQAFAKAQELALLEQLYAATTEQEKHQLAYLLDELAAQRQAQPLPVNVLRVYAGTYGPLTIYLNKNKLFCKNTEAGGLLTELKHISNRRFVLDDTAHVEFVKDSKGRYPTIKLYVSDGNIVEERRKGLH
ncbi:S41 family peptidase [Spirosoma pollinicola]|nr:S41 family peptidase [Spirosoma pollinicola]